MRVAAIQMDLVWEQPARNLERAAALLAEAAAGGAALAVLPEMFATGFSMAAAATAEPPGGPVQAFLAEQARAHGMHLVATAAVLVDGRPANAALHVGPTGEVCAVRAKLHPFTFAGEHRHFAPGEDLRPSAAGDLRLGLAVCYDLRFPELFRALTFRGATVLVVPANWPEQRAFAWSRLLEARAIEDQCFVVGVNRVGEGGGLRYDGRSAILGPLGETLATAVGEERVLLADLDPAVLARVRAELPFLADARRDLFPGLWGPTG